MPTEIVEELVRAGVASVDVDLGDPGVTYDHSTARADLPPYLGPSAPAGGHVHEWGASLAEGSDDAPLEGPALAPYAPAGAESSSDD